MDNPGISSASPDGTATRSGHPDPNLSTPKMVTKTDQEHAISAATSSKPPHPAVAKKEPAMKPSLRLLNPLQVQVGQQPSRPHSQALHSKG